MSQNNSQNFQRTSPARVGKMMAIMLGVCLIGGIVFFSMWDYWISEPPNVIKVMAGDVDHSGPAEATGNPPRPLASGRVEGVSLVN